MDTSIYIGQGDPLVEHVEPSKRQTRVRLWTQLPRSASFPHVLATSRSFVSTFCLHPNRHKSMILLGSVSLQLMMLSDYQIQFIWQWKEIVLCYCPPCVGNCIFDEQSCWPSSRNSWEHELVAGASGEKSQEPVPRLPPPIEGEAAPIPVVLWTMFVICWFSLANTYTNNYPCKRTLY